MPITPDFGTQLSSIVPGRSTKQTEAAYLLGRLLNMDFWLRWQWLFGPSNECHLSETWQQIDYCIVKLTKLHQRPPIDSVFACDRSAFRDWFRSAAAETLMEEVAANKKTTVGTRWSGDLDDFLDKLRRVVFGEAVWQHVRLGATLDQGLRRMREEVGDSVSTLFPVDEAISSLKFHECWLTAVEQDHKDIVAPRLVSSELFSDPVNFANDFEQFDVRLRRQLGGDYPPEIGNLVKPGYFDLIVDPDRKTVGRRGNTAVVQLTEQTWWIFNTIFRAAGMVLTWDDVRDGYEFSWRGRHTALNSLRSNLSPLGIGLVRGRLRFCEID